MLSVLSNLHINLYNVNVVKFAKGNERSMSDVDAFSRLFYLYKDISRLACLFSIYNSEEPALKYRHYSHLVALVKFNKFFKLKSY